MYLRELWKSRRKLSPFCNLPCKSQGEALRAETL